MPVKMAKVESRFPLHEAAKRCDSGTIGALLREGGADVNAKDADGLPALYHAVHHGDCPQCDGPEEAVRLLCESGADVHETFPGMDPLKPTYLLMAMCGFTVPVIQALLTAGANPNVANVRGRTALYIACYYKRLDVVELLLRHGADTNQVDAAHSAPLHAAVQWCNPFDVIRRSAAPGDDSSTIDSIVRRLLEHGARVNVRDAAGNLPLHLAISNNKRRYVDRLCHDVEILLKHGSDVLEPCGFNQFNTLQLAACNGKCVAVKHCLENNMCPNKYENFQVSPLNLAVKGNHPQATRCLLRHGAAINRSRGEISVLHTAGFEGLPDMVQLLLEHGADPRRHGFPLHWIQNANGPVPLLSPGHVKAVKLLVANGASLFLDNSGRAHQPSGIVTLHFLLKSESGHREYRGRVNTIFFNPELQTSFANKIFLHLLAESAIRLQDPDRAISFHLDARHVKHFIKTTCAEKLYIMRLAGFRFQLLSSMLKYGDCMRDKLCGKWKDVYGQLQQPLGLRECSRIAIRHAIASRFSASVRTLPLPKCLQEYVLMSDVL